MHNWLLYMSREHDIAFVDVSVLLSCIGKSRRDLHYVNVSVLIKFSQKTNVFTLIVISSP